MVQLSKLFLIFVALSGEMDDRHRGKQFALTRQ